MPAPLTVATSSDLEILITRTFEAPRALVFLCYSKPDLVRRWLGPPDWTMPVCDIDFRVGGKWRYVLKSPDGSMEMGFGGVYREIAAPTRIVNTELYDHDWTGGETLASATFEQCSGTTTVSTLVHYASVAARDNVLASPMAQGMEVSYGRLDTLLSAQAA
ncbi:MAG TPA: SRPBCC family protein [Devosiaceae bacterium]|jgi:uncharacterized protein YndB with AHSA1/START domain